jgi:hypothetical protein
VVNPTQRFRTKSHHFRYKTLPEKFYSDTLIGNITSIRQHKYAQVTTNGLGFTRFLLMEKKSDALQGIVDFIHNAGVPEWLITNNSKEQYSKAFGEVVCKFHIRHTFTKLHSPWQDRAEIEIKEIKEQVRLWTRKKQSLKRLWCYCGTVAAAIRRLTASSNPELNGRSPKEHVTGTPVKSAPSRLIVVWLELVPLVKSNVGPVSPNLVACSWPEVSQVQ